MKKDKLLELICHVVPEPESVIGVDEHYATDAVSFSWRGLLFVVTTALEVTESKIGITTAHSLLMQALLREAAH